MLKICGQATGDRCSGAEASGTIQRGPMELLPYSPERDVYRLLRIDPRAGHEEIVAACRRLARTFHPDHNGSERANDEMRVVNAVRGLLSDPSARAEYDIARLRFLTMDARRRSPQARRAPVLPPQLDGRRATLGMGALLLLNARAAWRGVRAAVAVLGPVRCSRCRSAVGRDDVFCALCGQRLLLTAAGRGSVRNARGSVPPRRFPARPTLG